MKANVLLSLLALTLLICACTRRPDGVLNDKKMASVVTDMELAEAYLETLPATKADDQRDQVVQYVLRKHGVSRQDFDSTMSWYGRNVDAYYEMCAIAEKQMQKRKKQVAGNSSVEIETSDFWPYERQAFLSSLSGTKSMIFEIPTAELESGSRLNLKFNISDPASSSMILGVEYDNGSISYLSRRIGEQKRADMTIQTDSSRSVTRIFGNYTILDSTKLPVWIDSIYLSALPFDSLEYHKIHSQRSSKR